MARELRVGGVTPFSATDYPGQLAAVVFSGGEACMDPALENAMRDVKARGFKVGLHTACIYPQRLRQVLPLVDWVGFDIKAAFTEYRAITGIANSGDPARACLDAIVASGVAHECRTTIHPALLPDAALLELAAMLAEKGVSNYVLQQFSKAGCTDTDLLNATLHGYPAAATLSQLAAMFPRFTFR